MCRTEGISTSGGLVMHPAGSSCMRLLHWWRLVCKWRHAFNTMACLSCWQAGPVTIPEMLSAATALLQYNTRLPAFRTAAEDAAAERAAASSSALTLHKVQRLVPPLMSASNVLARPEAQWLTVCVLRDADYMLAYKMPMLPDCRAHTDSAWPVAVIRPATDARLCRSQPATRSQTWMRPQSLCSALFITGGLLRSRPCRTRCQR